MKGKSAIIAIIIITTVLASANVIDIMKVTAKSGLRMRSGPGTGYKKLGLIPNGSIVDVLEKKGKTVTIAGTNGRWTKVRWKGRTGWVFGGFLVQADPEDEGMNAMPEVWFPADFPEKWFKLHKHGEQYVLMKWCFAGIPTVALNTGERKIIFFHGQDADSYKVGSVTKTPKGFKFTVVHHDGKENQRVFKWIKLGRTGTWNSTRYVADKYRYGYRTVYEKDGKCGEP